MGFTRAKVYNLSFEQPDLAGLEVKVRSMPLERYFAVRALWRAEDKTLDEKEVESRATFAEHLVSWNLEDDDGAAVPATLDGLAGQDYAFVDALVGAWMTTIGGVPIAGPLVENSPDGPLLDPGSIPTEPLSESPVS